MDSGQTEVGRRIRGFVGRVIRGLRGVGFSLVLFIFVFMMCYFKVRKIVVKVVFQFVGKIQFLYIQFIYFSFQESVGGFVSLVQLVVISRVKSIARLVSGFSFCQMFVLVLLFWWGLVVWGNFFFGYEVGGQQQLGAFGYVVGVVLFWAFQVVWCGCLIFGWLR